MPKSQSSSKLASRHKTEMAAAKAAAEKILSLQIEVTELRSKHAVLVVEIQVQREKLNSLIEMLSDVRNCETTNNDVRDSSPAYYLKSAIPTEKIVVGEKPEKTQIATILEYATETYDRLSRLKTVNQTDKSISIPDISLLFECQSLRQRLSDQKTRATQAENSYERQTKRLNKLLTQWHTAALCYNMRPITDDLPTLKPPPRGLQWRATAKPNVQNPVKESSPAQANSFLLQLKIPKPPANLRKKYLAKQNIVSPRRDCPMPEDKPLPNAAKVIHESGLDATSCCIKGMKLFISSFCTDVGLLLHRFVEACDLKTPSAVQLLSAPPFFTRDKVSHCLLVESGYCNPFENEVAILHDLYQTVLSCILPLAVPKSQSCSMRETAEKVAKEVRKKANKTSA